MRQQQAAVSGGRFALMEPLVAFQSVLLQTLVRPIEEVMTLQLASIRAARKAGQLAWAGTSMARIRAAAGMAGPNHQLARPDAAWRLEDVKVLWAEGHRELALRLVHGLAESMDRCRDAGSSYAAQAYSLAACWLASERAGSPTDVVELMEKASQLSQREGGPEESRIACR